VELGNVLDQAGDQAGAVRAFRQAAASVNLLATVDPPGVAGTPARRRQGDPAARSTASG
jgi:hypothetical protein